MINRNYINLVAAGAALLVAGLGHSAASAASANADAKAKILKKVTITKSSDLDYGIIVVGATADTVALTSGGTLTCGTSLVCKGTATAAGFNVTGTAAQLVNVTVPASVTLNSGTNSMSSTLSGSAASLTLSATGTGTIKVGGTLSVGANQADGDYLGTFAVSADYN